MTDTQKIMSTPLPEPVMGTGYAKIEPAIPSFEELLEYHDWQYEIHHSKIGDNAVIFYHALPQADQDLAIKFCTTLKDVQCALASYDFLTQILEDTVEVFELNDLSVEPSIARDAEGLATLVEFARLKESQGMELDPTPAYCYARAALEPYRIELPDDITAALSDNAAGKGLFI